MKAWLEGEVVMMSNWAVYVKAGNLPTSNLRLFEVSRASLLLKRFLDFMSLLPAKTIFGCLCRAVWHSCPDFVPPLLDVLRDRLWSVFPMQFNWFGGKTGARVCDVQTFVKSRASGVLFCSELESDKCAFVGRVWHQAKMSRSPGFSNTEGLHYCFRSLCSPLLTNS